MSYKEKDCYDLAVVATKAQAKKYVKDGKYKDKTKWATRIVRKHNKNIPGSKPFYTIFIFKKKK